MGLNRVREIFSDFLQRLTRAVQREVTDLKHTQTHTHIIEPLAYENVNIECKQILGPLKMRSTPVDKWVLHTVNVKTLDYGTEAWIREAIFNGKKILPNVLIVVEWDI